LDYHHAAVLGGIVYLEAQMKTMQDQTVLVLGLGASGLAMVRWCVAQGALVTVLDNRDQTPNDARLGQDFPAVRRLHGGFTAAILEGNVFTKVCVSPGLSPAEITPLTEAATAQGIVVVGELGLFQAGLAALATEREYTPKVIAITGTNGKTTVTALTAQLLERAGLTVAVAGNIGPTLLDTLQQRLHDDSLPSVWVLELSSFQLHYGPAFEASAATVLNVTQDHLDWHGSFEAYRGDKLKVFGTNTTRLVNRDDRALAQLATPIAAPAAKGAIKALLPDCTTFGSDTPRTAGDYGLETVNGMTWLVKAQLLDPARKTKRGAPDEEVELLMQRLMPAEALRIRGRHNALNALAALALAESTGANLAPMLFGMREYRGEPHRVESVGVVNGVEYFDDSKGTNVGATVAAVEGLGQERKLVMIMGGDGKGQDFSPLVKPLVQYAKACILIGRDAPLLVQALSGSGVVVHLSDSLEAAVEKAAACAQSGDAVLMSPACASLDMFRNYEHRANVFVQAVKAIASDAGVGITHG
jgi:UDP-N-acetylmuramoylalanine--D-glutamate ligase